jgi:hypothetical protein
MSTKVAVIIGDYSNGWSDAWIVQGVLEIPNMAALKKDQKSVLGELNRVLLDLIQSLDKNEYINPKPKDEACCDKFVYWFSAHSVTDKESFKACTFCGEKITDERRKKFSNQ